MRGKPWRQILRLSLAITSILSVIDFSEAICSQAASAPTIVKIVLSDDDGNQTEVFTPKPGYLDFITNMRSRIDSQRAIAKERVAVSIIKELTFLSKAMTLGADQYVDWYFTWGTTSSIAFTATKSYLSAIGTEGSTPRAQAETSINKVFEDKFTELVLSPERNSPKLKEVMQKILIFERDECEIFLSQINNSIRDYAKLLRGSNKSHIVSDISSSGIDVVDWTHYEESIKSLLSDEDQSHVSPSLTSTQAMDFSDMARSAFVQGVINNVAGYTTSFAAPMLTVLDSGATLTAFLTTTFGPLGIWLTPEMIVTSTGIAMATDFALVKATEFSIREDILKSAKGGIDTITIRLNELIHKESNHYIDHLYDGLSAALFVGRI